MSEAKRPVKRTETQMLVQQRQQLNAEIPLWGKIFPCCYRGEWVDTMTEKREIFTNRPQANALNPHQFPDNAVTTSKYTVLSFLPKNLYEQFSKAANFYFLLMAILVSIPGISTIEPYTSILPLLFVLSVTAIKEGFEDHARHQSDIETNETITRIVQDGELVDTKWQDVRVGDIVKVLDGEMFTADMVLLSSSDAEGNCNIMTANLDGETNLKTRMALNSTRKLRTPKQLFDLSAKCTAQAPTAKLEEFEGVWQDRNSEQQLAVDASSLLLRGAKLKETEWVFGLVVYTGIHTKLVLNSNNPRYKRSKVEWSMNSQMYLIFIMQFFIVLLCAIIGGAWQYRSVADHWYLDDSSSTNGAIITGVRNFFAYYILFSVMVPISLYVSIELVKVGQSLFIWWDIKMYDRFTDSRALARTSNLNEELGQVKYVFSDKTGTLTQNKMSFYKCSINGVAYGQDIEEEHVDENNADAVIERSMTMSSKRAAGSTVSLHMAEKMSSFSKFNDPRLLGDLKGPNGRGDSAQSQAIDDFLMCMAVCHSTDVVNADAEESKSGQLEYRGVSVDEVALVIAANELGYRFTMRDRDTITVDTPFQKKMKIQILQILDFTSERKRMTVIARLPDGRLRAYAKGADNMMVALAAPDQDDEMMKATKKHLDDYSTAGLRTLVLGYNDLDEDTYAKWAARYEAASREIGDRKKKMEAVQSEIEHDFQWLGVTAIEDALQVGVVDTLVKLRHATMKVWMLTGDKQGTAVNIGKSCGLIDPAFEIAYLNGDDPETMGACVQKVMGRLKKAEEVKQRQLSQKHSKTSSTAGDEVRVEIGRGNSHRAVTSTMLAGLDGSAAPDAELLSDDKKEIEMEPNRKPSATVRSGAGFALVVDGPELSHALVDDASKKVFFELINHPQTSVVICSRMAPAQKAEIVTLVKNGLPDVITLAIGDGANDVSMIQAAHVGVGIRGKEGLQAVNTSDFAIGQFRFLARLLLVHGRLSYKRNTKLILYSFYKSFAITFTQFFFSCVSVFSAQEIYDGVLLNTFNLFFASLPIICYALFDLDLLPEDLLRFPIVYKAGIDCTSFNYKVYWTWVATGVWHALWAFFIPWYSLQHLGLWGQSMGTYGCLVVVVNMKMAVMTNTWTGWNHFVIWGSIAIWFLFSVVWASVSFEDLFPNLTGTFDAIVGETAFWLSLLFCAWMAMAQDYVYRYCQFELWPLTLKQWIRIKRKEKFDFSDIDRETERQNALTANQT